LPRCASASQWYSSTTSSRNASSDVAGCAVAASVRGAAGGDVDDRALHGFERGDDDRGVGIHAKVAGHDADVPVAGAPLGEFVVGEGAGGNGEERAAGEIGLLGPALEDVGLARARGRVDDHVLPFAERGQREGLPPVRQHQFLQTGERVGEHVRSVCGRGGASNGACARDGDSSRLRRRGGAKRG
jgi:hypothetical protein